MKAELSWLEQDAARPSRHPLRDTWDSTDEQGKPHRTKQNSERNMDFAICISQHKLFVDWAWSEQTELETPMKKSVGPLLVPRQASHCRNQFLDYVCWKNYVQTALWDPGSRKAKFSYSITLFLSAVHLLGPQSTRGEWDIWKFIEHCIWSPSTQPRQLGHIPQVLAFSVPQLYSMKSGLIANQ